MRAELSRALPWTSRHRLIPCFILLSNQLHNAIVVMLYIMYSTMLEGGSWRLTQCYQVHIIGVASTHNNIALDLTDFIGI